MEGQPEDLRPPLQPAAVFLMPETPNLRISGYVRSWNEKKGYGFVTPAEDEHQLDWDYFAYHDEIVRRGFRFLNEGDEVEFTPGVSTRNGRPRAIRITKPGGAPFPRDPPSPHNPPPGSFRSGTRVSTDFISSSYP